MRLFALSNSLSLRLHLYSGLTSPHTTTRWLILQKARRHPTRRLRPAGSTWFQDLFHSPSRGSFHRSLTVLVHYRSQAVFSLGMWSSLLPTGFRVSGSTHVHDAAVCQLQLRVSHPLRMALPIPFASPTHATVEAQEDFPVRRTTPMQQRFLPHTLHWVWAPPGSFATTTGIFSFPRGTLDVSVPPVPPAALNAVGHLFPGGVAPFGVFGIAGCQHLPQTFRSVATSFIGCLRQGIHHVLFFDYVNVTQCLYRVCYGARGDTSVSSPRSQVRSTHFQLSRFQNQHTNKKVEPRGLEPRTSAVQGRRSPS